MPAGADRCYDIVRQANYPAGRRISQVLLFSGGRDSTCAAVRLLNGGHTPLLLTVVDAAVQSDEETWLRVQELQRVLHYGFPWLSIQAPEFYRHMLDQRVVNSPSCLDCFLVRLSVAVVVAKRHKVNTIAAGFTGYQAAWIEQSPAAIDGIKEFLQEYNLTFLLPVHDLTSQEQAKQVLAQQGLLQESFEPRCHCADEGTKENGDPMSIKVDISTLATHCREFVARCLREDGA